MVRTKYYRHYYLKHKKRFLYRAKRWASKNPKKRKAIKDRWRRSHPDHIRAQNARIRARRLKADGHYTAQELRDLRRRQRSRCAKCREKLPDNFHADHIIPITKYGSNLIKNIQLLCPTCNRKKSNRLNHQE